MSGEAIFKNILMITPCAPDENGSGTFKRAAAHLKTLCGIYRVHLLIFTHDPVIPESRLEWLKSQCVSVVIIPSTKLDPRGPSLPPKATMEEIFNSELYSGLPSDNWLLRAVNKLGMTGFDAIFCFRISSALLLNRMQRVTSISARRKIVDFDDIESISKKRAAKFVKMGIEIAVINKIIYWRLQKIENDLLRTYQDVLVCSDLDKKLLQSRGSKAAIHAIPNSIALQPVTPPLQERDTLHILFVGIMSYAPNEDGVIWFCREILPLIRNQTKCRLRVSLVGYHPPHKVADLAKEIDDVTVTGGVESVAPYYKDCDLVIAPIRFGAGTRIKILEAMSFQKPVVSTTIGAEGIDIEDGLNIMIGDSPESFASACVTLLENTSRRLAMGQQGRKCIEEKYSAEVVAGRLEQILIS